MDVSAVICARAGGRPGKPHQHGPCRGFAARHAACCLGQTVRSQEYWKLRSYLSLTLLLGLVANSVAGWWWANPLAALLMVPWLIKEGLEGLRGGEC